jgi:hypothetical protein
MASYHHQLLASSTNDKEDPSAPSNFPPDSYQKVHQLTTLRGGQEKLLCLQKPRRFKLSDTAKRLKDTDGSHRTDIVLQATEYQILGTD